MANHPDRERILLALQTQMAAEERLRKLDSTKENSEAIELLIEEIAGVLAKLQEHRPHLHPTVEAGSIAVLGTAYFKRFKGTRSDNLREGIHRLEEALTTLLEHGDDWSIAAISHSLGTAYANYEHGDPRDNRAKAEHHLRTAVERFGRGQFDTYSRKATSDLARLLKRGHSEGREGAVKKDAASGVSIVATTDDLPTLRGLFSRRSVSSAKLRKHLQTVDDSVAQSLRLEDGELRTEGTVLILDTRQETREFRGALLRYLSTGRFAIWSVAILGVVFFGTFALARWGIVNLSVSKLTMGFGAAGLVVASWAALRFLVVLTPFMGTKYLPRLLDASFREALKTKAAVAKAIETDGQLDSIWQQENERSRALWRHLVETRQPYGLYLRNFELEANTGHLKTDLLGEVGTQVYRCELRPDTTFEQEFVKRIGNIPSMFAASNRHDLLGYRRPLPRIYLSEADWQVELMSLVDGAKLIIVHASMPSASIRFELDAIRQAGKQKQTAILVAARAASDDSFDEHVTWNTTSGFLSSGEAHVLDAVSMIGSKEFSDFTIFAESDVVVPLERWLMLSPDLEEWRRASTLGSMEEHR